jgi:NAD(P)-dependent dehydrogenase (short-subunit alcohol dehydrogenase family)
MEAEVRTDFKPATILVIGGSAGIGLGFVRHYLKDQSVERIFTASRDPVASEELCLLKATHRDKLFPLALDVTKEHDFEKMVSEIRVVTSEIDFVIYTTGVLQEGELQPEKSLRQIKAENLIRSFQVNAVGAVLAAKYLQSFLSHNRMSTFAAISAKVGSIEDNRIGGWYGYRASKAALNMFLKTIAIEFGRSCKNTTVLALHPGTTDTRLSKPFQKNVPPGKLFPVEKTVQLLDGIIKRSRIQESGSFYSWDGTKLPW